MSTVSLRSWALPERSIPATRGLNKWLTIREKYPSYQRVKQVANSVETPAQRLKKRIFNNL